LQEVTCPSLQILQVKCACFKFLRHKYEFVDTYLFSLSGHYTSVQKEEMDCYWFLSLYGAPQLGESVYNHPINWLVACKPGAVP